jgi:hypothetical protein
MQRLLSLLFFPDLAAVPTVSRPTLVPRAAWMLDDDDRTDSQADADWHQACDHLFGPPPDDSTARPVPDCPPPPRFYSGEFIDGEIPDGTGPPSPATITPLPLVSATSSADDATDDANAFDHRSRDHD